MISEQDKQAILNGAYGITNDGKKAKYIGSYASSDFPYYFVFLNEDGEICKGTSLTGSFREYEEAYSHWDIIGLWQDKPEPFDLEKALAGELVKYSDKPCYVYQSNVTGLFWVEAQDGSFVDNDTSLEAVSEQGMWKEPEPKTDTVTVTVPRALKQPQTDMWYIYSNAIVKSVYNEDVTSEDFNRRPYFATKEAAQAWFQAMLDSRDI